MALASSGEFIEARQDKSIRLVLVDELGLFRMSLARFLSSEPGYAVVGECGTSTEALRLLKSSTPDVVLLDFEIGTEHGTDFMSTARRAGYPGHFLIVAHAPDVRKSAFALKIGASGIFLKSEPPERLLKAILAVADGGVWVDLQIIQLLANQFIDQYPPFIEKWSGKPLDERERDVLLGILGGLSNRKIGDNLGISESQVKNVVQRLFSKSGVKTRSQLVRVALDGSLDAARESMKYEPTKPAVPDQTRSRELRQLVNPIQTISQSHG